MRVDVVGRGLEVTAAMKSHAEEKAGKLPKFFSGVQQVVVTLAKADHHATGEFHVEVRVDVEKHDDFVIHQQGLDLYGAIDGAMHKAERLLHEHKERIKPGMHRER